MNISRWCLTKEEYARLYAFDVNKIHQKVTDIFYHNLQKPDNEFVRFDMNINNRTNQIIILIQSDTEPNNIPSIGLFATKTVNLENITDGIYKICGKVNPVIQKKIAGKKHSVKYSIHNDEKFKKWVHNNEKKWGIKISDFTIIGGKWINFKHKEEKIYYYAYNFSIICKVVDVLKFRNFIHRGTGSKRAFGCSLIQFFKLY